MYPSLVYILGFEVFSNRKQFNRIKPAGEW